MSDPLVAVEGVFVEEKWLYLAEILQDYNPQLELKYIPTERRSFEDRSMPYMVTHKDKSGREYVVTYANEAEHPAEVLNRVFHNDMKHGNVYDRMQIRNSAYKIMETYKRAEEMAEAEDLAKFMVGSNKNWIKLKDKHGEIRKFDSNRNNVGTGRQYL